MDIVAFLSNLPELLGFHLAVIFGLIAFDVLTGIGRSVRQRYFDWLWVANFYRTNVVPYVLGYLGYAGFVLFVGPYLTDLPAEVESLIGDGAAWVGFGAIAVAIGASIRRNIQGIIAEPVALPAWPGYPPIGGTAGIDEFSVDLDPGLPTDQPVEADVDDDLPF